jgi:hypothetical protein
VAIGSNHDLHVVLDDGSELVDITKISSEIAGANELATWRAEGIIVGRRLPSGECKAESSDKRVHELMAKNLHDLAIRVASGELLCSIHFEGMGTGVYNIVLSHAEPHW